MTSSTSAAAPKLRMVNLGCGLQNHPDWENYDLTPLSSTVRPVNLNEALPFEDGTVDVVYASHVIEHLQRSDVPRVLGEMRRILRPAGIVRLVVPDLEAIVRGYVSFLDAVRNGGGAVAEAGHEWMSMELLDQMTRTCSGGFMGRLWQSKPFLARDLVKKRFGREFAAWLEIHEANLAKGRSAPLTPTEVYELPKSTTEEKVAFLGTGENHLWMYDEISLGMLMLQAGFASPRAVAAGESEIPGFAAFELDTYADGEARKPDSLFMEAGGNFKKPKKAGLVSRLWGKVWPRASR